jgi:hypothetical protein
MIYTYTEFTHRIHTPYIDTYMHNTGSHPDLITLRFDHAIFRPNLD